MDVELDYDIDKKKNLKEVKLFLSIAPNFTHKSGVTSDDKSSGISNSNNFVHYEIPPLHYPIKNLFTEKTKYIIENKQNFLSFYSKKEETFHEILSNTFFVIAIDKDFTSYNKAIANFVKICYGGEELNNFDSPTQESSDNQIEDNESRIFITNYSLIKKLYEEDLKEIKVYMLPKEKDCEVSSLFRKLDYTFRIIQNQNLRFEYFTDIAKKYNLIKLEINERFLKIRNEFLRTFNKKSHCEIFKDPINKDTVFPVLNIMVLNYSNELNQFNHKDEYHVNQIDFKFYESEFIRKYQKNLVNSDITYAAYLDADQIFQNNEEFWQEFPVSPCDFFIDKNISINFGKIEKIGELGCGQYNFMKSCSGSLIYSTQFMPLGITTIKLNNCSLLTNKSTRKESTNNSNIFIPFSNKAVISVFKKLMNIQTDCKENPANNKLFLVEKPSFLNENNILVNNYLWKSEIIEQSTPFDTATDKNSCAYFNYAKLDDDSEKKKDKKNIKNSYFMNNIARKNSIFKLDQAKLNQMNRLLNEKHQNKSFNYAPFNIIVEDKKNFNRSLADYIDETISNLFK